MGCICQKCGKDYKVDLLVSDDIWELIKPINKAHGAGLLCGKCIMENIENLGNYDSYYMVNEDKYPIVTKIYECDDWPGAVSDGLNLSCKMCGCYSDFDYHVSDKFWKIVVPLNMRQDVICLPCLDTLSKESNICISEYLEEIQYTGNKHTTILKPIKIFKYD